jgi:undecaprenyl pyrophosphate phosphatase UppP
VRRFKRRESSRLSRQIALPVITGASLLKALRLRPGRLPPDVRVPFALGAASSFVSALASARLLCRIEPGGSLAPYALYRLALAAAVLMRLSSERP